MDIYYCKDGLVFGLDKTKISLLPETKLEINKSSKKEFIQTLTENINSLFKKNIDIYGKIEEFEKLKVKFSKNEVKTILENETVEFLEITSSLVLIQSLLLSFKEIPFSNSNNIFEEFEKFKKKETIEDETLTKEKEELEFQIKEEEKIRTKISNKVLNEEKKIEQKELKIEIAYKESQKKLENKLDSQKKNHKQLQEIRTLKQKISSCENKVQELKLEIEINKTKIKTLQKEKEMGVERQFRPILSLLTLGLGHWTKYSTTKYLIQKEQFSIYKNKENIAKTDKKKFQIETLLQTIQEEISFIEIEKSKDIEKSLKESEKESQILKKEEIEVENLKNDVKTLQKKLEKQNLIVEKLEHKQIQIKSKVKEFNKTSVQNVELKIENIISKQKNTLQEIKKLEKQIKSQKISYVKEGKFEC